MFIGIYNHITHLNRLLSKENHSVEVSWYVKADLDEGNNHVRLF